MTEPTIQYTITFEIHDGSHDAFEQTAQEAIQRVEKEEPETVLYEWFVSEDGESARAVEGFTSSEAAVSHITGPAVTQMLPELLESADITEIEVFGTPSEKLAEVLSDFPVSGPYAPLDGFTR